MGSTIYQQPTRLASEVAATSNAWLVMWDQSSAGRKNHKINLDELKTLLGVTSGGGGGSVADGSITTAKLADNAVTSAKIAGSAVTYSKIQNVSATDKLLGRSTAGAGVVEEITCTAFARTILDDADATAVKNTIGAADFTQTANSLSVLSTSLLAKLDASAVSAFMLTVLDDANASTARTTLGLGALATVASVGTSEITNSSVTYAKIQNVSATDRILGRSTAGAGVVEEITCTAFGRSFIDDADATAGRTTLGLGSLATLSAVGTAQITDGNVTLAKLANSGAASVLLGRGAGAGAGVYQELTLGSGLSLTGTVLSASGGGGGTPGGADTQIQFNNAGAFGGSSNLTWNGSTVGVTGGVTLSGTLTVGATPLVQDAADILAQRRSTNGNTLKVYRTFTSSSTFERGTFGWHDSSSDTGTVGNTLRIGTEKGSVGGTARDVSIITNGVNRITVAANSQVTATFDTGVVSNGFFLNGTNGNTYVTMGAGGISTQGSWAQLTTISGTTGRLNIGAGQCHLTHEAGNLTVLTTFGNLAIRPGGLGGSGTKLVFLDKNIELGTTTGTKIGTATGEKLGFWNATPVVQQVLATGAGATVDNVITLLQTLGLCKQS